MTLQFDEGRQVVHDECADCGTPQTRVTGFVLMYGRKLSREDGLAHPQRDEFWALVDHILINDPDVAVHMGYAREEDVARPMSALLVSIRDRLRRALLNPRRGA